MRIMFFSRGLLKIPAYLSACPPSEVDRRHCVGMSHEVTAHTVKRFSPPVRFLAVSAGRAGDARPCRPLLENECPHDFWWGHIPLLKNLPQLQFQQRIRYSSETGVFSKKKRNACKPLFFRSLLPSPLMWSIVRKSTSCSPQHAHFPPYFSITASFARSRLLLFSRFLFCTKAASFLSPSYRSRADFLLLSLTRSGCFFAKSKWALRMISRPCGDWRYALVFAFSHFLQTRLRSNSLSPRL